MTPYGKSGAAGASIPGGNGVNLQLVRHGYLADDRPVELTRSLYRADRYDFVAEMRRN